MLYQTLFDDVRSAILALKCEIAAERVLAAGRRLIGLLGKANFNPAQLRIPAGEAGGGRWADDGGSGVILTGARGRSAVRVRVGRQSLEATPGQAARLAVADAWARDAASRVQEIEPTWRPTPSLAAQSRARSRRAKGKRARPRPGCTSWCAEDMATMADHHSIPSRRGRALGHRRQLSASPLTGRSLACQILAQAQPRDGTTARWRLSKSMVALSSASTRMRRVM